jgi:hypothetical protein
MFHSAQLTCTTLLIVRMILLGCLLGSEYYFHCSILLLSIYVLYTHGVLFLPPANDFSNVVWMSGVTLQKWLYDSKGFHPILWWVSFDLAYTKLNLFLPLQSSLYRLKSQHSVYEPLAYNDVWFPRKNIFFLKGMNTFTLWHTTVVFHPQKKTYT